LVYADDVNISGVCVCVCVHTIRKNTEAFVVSSKEIGPEVNAKKTMYLATS